MPRAKKGPARRRAKNRILKAAKGYRGGRSKLYRTAKEATRRAAHYSYQHRRTRGRQFRRLWIMRINAACRQRGISYSRFINGLLKAEIDINRAQLAAMAIDDPSGFDRLAEIAKEAVGQTSDAA